MASFSAGRRDRSPCAGMSLLAVAASSSGNSISIEQQRFRRASLVQDR